MKTKSIILLNIVLLCFALNAQAQTEDIGQQITDYKNSRMVLISNARSLLFDKIEAGDLSSAAQITDFIIDSLETREYLGLWDVEKILIYYNLHDYNSLLNEFRIADTTNVSRNNNLRYRITPSRDLLFKRLQNKSADNYEELADSIDLADLPEEDKSFLQLALVYMIYNTENAFSNQDEINSLSNKYIENYPQSPHNKLIKTHIREEYVFSGWGFGLEFSSGYGIFTSELKQTFTNPIPLVFAFDVEYKKFISNIRIYCGLNKTKKDIAYEHKGEEWYWTKDALARTFIPELSLGYTVWENKIVKMYPYTLIGLNNTTPTAKDREDYPELKDANITSFTYGLGLNFDFKIRSNNFVVINESSSSSGYIGIRVRYSYKWNNFKHYSGNFHDITVGIVLFGRGSRLKVN